MEPQLRTMSSQSGHIASRSVLEHSHDRLRSARLSKNKRSGLRLLTTAVCACIVCLPDLSFAQSSVASFDALMQSAKSDLAENRYSASKAELEAAVALEPQRAEAWTELGILYGRIDDFRSAEAALRHSLQLDPGQASAHYLLGLSLIANPQSKLDWPDAIAEFREALKLKPVYPEAMDYLGVGLTALGQTDEAVTTLRHAVEMAPDEAEPHFNLALALENRGDLEAAAEQYRKALAAKPDDSDADSALGKLLLRTGHVQEAESRLRDALRIDPDLQDAHYALSHVLRDERKMGPSQNELDEAVALGQREPNAAESIRLSNEALGLAAKGDMAGAEADLRRAVRLRPDYGVPHYNLGLILADERHMGEAAQQLMQAISLMPGRVRPWIDLAKVQRLQGDVVSARRSLAWALQLAPGNEEAQRELQALPPASGSAAQASGSDADAERKMPWAGADIPATHDRYARQLEAQSDWLGAAGEWLRSLKLQANAVPARLELANCLEHMGDGVDAILEERKALLVDPASSAAHLALGRSLMEAGSKPEAREQFQRVLALDPGSAVAASSLKKLNTP